jgi:signal transduction histidine kinase
MVENRRQSVIQETGRQGGHAAPSQRQEWPMDTMPQLSLTWIYNLFRVGQEAAAASSDERAVQELLGHIVSGFKASSGSLAFSAADKQQLRIVAGTNIPKEAIGSLIPSGDGVLGWVAVERQALLLNGDISGDPRFRNLKKRTTSGIPVVAMCQPLLLGNELLGVMSLNRQQGEPGFTPQDLEHGGVICNLIALVVENLRLHGAERTRQRELEAAYQTLAATQSQLLQSEKMASIGQLAAGVAHEINNPVGYVNSNLGTLQGYVNDLFRLLATYEKAEPLLSADPALQTEIASLKQTLDLAFLREDTLNLVKESQEGLTRVKKIVQDLKEFSHVDRAEWQQADLHLGLDSTLNIVHNELKYKAEIIKDYGTLPPIECIPAQLNQVFMNILVNAAQAMDSRGAITIRTGMEDEGVYVEITDTGQGMPEEVKKRIFEPFFTTKPVGKGTGLGLSLSYSIVQKHHGRIDVTSAPGRGTRFRVWVPVGQTSENQ